MLTAHEYSSGKVTVTGPVRCDAATRLQSTILSAAKG